MEHKYDIENLELVFDRHAIHYEKTDGHLDVIEKFNFHRALKVICQEIIDMKKEVTSISDNIHGYDP